MTELGDYDGVCKYYNRVGQLCGECDKNYTLPVYSYYLGCVKCEDYRYGWVKFITAAFLPLTIFYIMVIVLRIIFSKWCCSCQPDHSNSNSNTITVFHHIWSKIP